MLIETDYKAFIGQGQGGHRAQGGGQGGDQGRDQANAEKDLLARAAGGVVVIGNFDGVHRGHCALLAQGRKIADDYAIPLVVLTFNPHPRLYFAPNQPAFLISMPAQKYALLQQAGADYVIDLKFNNDLANAEADEFIRYVLMHALGAHTIIVGEDFVFGKERGGDIALLQQYGAEHGFQVNPVALYHEGENRVSSGLVRDALCEGRISDANLLLGRPFQVVGKVITGHQRGRTIGFPTANISLGEYVHPALGSYAAKIRLTDTGEEHNAVVNIGKRPTIGDFNPIIEAHLLDFSGDLYGREIAIDFLEFIRAERKFDDLEALKAQIAQDVMQAKKLLGLS